MATLTANTPRLPDHCAHKLPTSCRLTALPICCACQDKRAHSSFYSKYVDGRGLRWEGTRQEQYCWFCKEFWNARIEASNVSQSSSRLPHVPDQTQFLELWFDWHRGYTVIKHPDGSEEHRALRGEALDQVPPGHLPRTWEEIGATPTHQRHLRHQQSLTVPHTNPSIPSQNSAYETPGFTVDPEDRIFDSSSSSCSSNESDLEGEADTDGQNLVEHRGLSQKIDQAQNNLDSALACIRELTHEYPIVRETLRQFNYSGRIMSIRSHLDRALEASHHPLRSASSADMSTNHHGGPAVSRGSTRRHQTAREPGAATGSRALRPNRIELRRADNVASASLQTTDLDPPTQERLNNITVLQRQRFHALNQAIQTAATGQASSIPEHLINTYDEPYSNEDTQSINIAADRALDYEFALSPLTSRGRLPEGPQWLPNFPSHQSPLDTDDISLDHDPEDFEGANRRSVSNTNSQGLQLPPFPPDWPSTSGDHRRNPMPAYRRVATPTRRYSGSIDSPTHALDPRLEASPWSAYDTTWRTNHGSRFRPSAFSPQPFEPSDGTEDSTGNHLPAHWANNPVRSHSFRAALALHGSGPDSDGASQRPIDLLYPGRVNDMSGPELRRLRSMAQRIRGAALAGHSQQPETQRSLDTDEKRPEPKTDEELKVKLECKICYTQVASVAILPCGHCVMCKWCAKQLMPPHKADRTRPANPLTDCPVCRKRVKQTVRIYTG